MERKIGEIFTDGDVTLKVVPNEACFGCFYDNVNCDKIRDVRGYCTASARSDKKPVAFIKQDQP